MEAADEHNKLLSEVEQLRKRVAELEKQTDQYKRQEDVLSGHLKEVNCLYRLSELITTPGISEDQLLQSAVELVPPAWLYPESTCARLQVGGKEFKTKNFQETQWRQSAPLVVSNKQAGRLEVFHLQEIFPLDEGLFWKKGRDLIEAVTEKLGQYLERHEARENLRQRPIEWALRYKPEKDTDYVPEYGDLSSLNQNGLLLTTVGLNQLEDIASEYLDLLETSAAIYERNGDYALGLFTSGWCRLMNTASRKLCRTDDNIEALNSGKWLCHESCWKDASLKSMIEGKPVDTECSGGINLYAVPVWADGEIVGSINFGYGTPPTDENKLQELSEKYRLSIDDLRAQAQAYQTRPQYLIDYAKVRIQKAANYLSYIIERKQIEKVIRESQEKLHVTLNSIGDAVIATNLQGHVTIMNPVAEALTGWTFEQAENHTLDQVFRIVNAHTGKKVANPLKRVLETGKIVGLANHTKLISKTGEVHQIADSAAPIKDENGQISGVVMVFRNVSEEYSMREALQLSEERLRVAASNLNGILYVLDTDLRFVVSKGAKLTALGLQDDQVVGKTLYDYFQTTDAAHPMIEKHRRVLSGAGSTIESEYGDVAFSTTLSPMRDSTGRIVGIVGLTMDISERKQAEQAVRESERRLATLLGNLPGMAYRCKNDVDWTMEFVSSGCLALTGYEPGEILGNAELSYFELIDPDDRDKVWQEVQRAVRNHRPFVIEYRIRDKGGRQHWVWEQGRIVDESGDGFAVLEGFIMDISERKWAEEALIIAKEHAEQNVAYLKTLIEKSPLPMVITDEKQDIESFNEKFIQTFGYTLEDVSTGEEWWHIAYPDAAYRERVQDSWMKAIESAVKNKTDIAMQTWDLTIKDGTKRSCEFHMVPLGSKNLIVMQDITERRQVEKEQERLTAQVREQARQMEHILDTVPAGVLLLDAAGRVLQANSVAVGDLAVSAGTKVGDVLTHLGGHPLAELLTSPPTKGLWHEVMVDGRIFEVIARPVKNGPEPEKWVLVINDATKERQIQAQLQQQTQLVAVGQLAAGIAHDFNNIMAVIVLYTQMGLSSPDTPKKLHKHLEIVLQQSIRASDLIQQILDFSRRAVLEPQPMNLTIFLKKVIELLERTVPEHILVQLDYGSGEYMVHADPTRIQQIVMNLAINARDAMPDGGRLRLCLDRITVSRDTAPPLPEMAAGEWVQLTVTDTGTGIPPKVLSHIFEPFFTTKEVDKGTGLGLAQVYGIVKQHEGHIDVATKIGEGTTFTIYLPALPVHSPETPVVETEISIRGHGETVLVVEDNAALREALADILELLNYRVLQASNGREALAVLDGHADEIMLVLSDLVMPEMGGQALFYAIKQRGWTLPVVMLSGHPLENQLREMQVQGLAGWMLKPLSRDQLAQLLARLLKKGAD